MFEWKVSHAPLSKVANVENASKNYIKTSGYEITKSCLNYILNLTEGEDYPSYSMGVPRYTSLNCKIVKKKLKKFNL